MKLIHFDSAYAYVLGEVLCRPPGWTWWRVIGWERRGEGYRITAERC